MKILISTSSFGKYDETLLRSLREKGFEVVLNPYGRKLTKEEIKKLIVDVDGLIAGTEPLSGDVLKAAKHLRVISRCGAGVDNIDLETARKLGIEIYSTPDAVTQAVAELTVGVMLDVLRSISAGDRLIRKGQWGKPMGSLLYGRTVGILGLGRIGKRIAELLSPFKVKYIARDIAPDTEFVRRYSIRLGGLKDVLREADIVTIHLPYTPELENFIGEKEIRLMKKNSILINVSRGELVDEEALYDALSEKRIAGAGIDVFVREPYSGPLKKMENVVLTPHIGSYAVEARIQMELEATENLLTGLKNSEGG